MKEKIINYIETLEAKAYQSDYYFKQRNEFYISNQEKDKEIERLNNIINELEKWLLEENKKKQKWYNEQLSINDRRYYEEKYLTSLTMINVFFDKLQELKGIKRELELLRQKKK